MRVADLLFETLLNYKINTCFSVTGRGSLFLTDALKKNNKIKSFFLHHEQSASFAAASYSELNTYPACCLVSTGCAATNTLTGVLSAWQDEIPIIFVSGQNTLNETTRYTKLKIRTYGQQEADIVSIVKPITKYAVMIDNPNLAEKEFNKAINISMQEPRGPVWIDIPIDIQNCRVEIRKKFKFNQKKFVCSTEEISYCLKEIQKAKRPILLIGSGVRSGNAEKLLKKFVEKFKIPLVYTSSAPDIYPLSHKLSIGSIGTQGCSRAGAFAVQNSDLLIVMGSSINSLVTGQDCRQFAKNAKIIAVNINKYEFKKKNIKIDKLIISRLNYFLEKITKYKIINTFDVWNKTNAYWKNYLNKFNPVENEINRIGLYKFSEKLSKLMKSQSVFICDSGFVDVILPTNIKFKIGQRCLHPASQGAMGYAIPAIVGAGANKIKKKQIIAVVGDGSLMMNLQELQTIKYYNIPCKIFVINNDMYGIIRRRQIELFRERTVGTDISNGVSSTEIKKISDCFGFKYYKIKDKDNLEEDLDKILKSNVSIICEIMGLLNQNYIEIGYNKNVNGKIIKRPIEDQSPFIDRKIFNREISRASF